MTTRLQTVEVYRPDCGLTLYSLEYAPVLDLSSINSWTEAVEFIDSKMGTRAAWFPEGYIEKTEADGTRKVFWIPPGIADAVHYTLGAGATFKFKKDSCVEARCYGANYYWGPPRKGTPEVFDESNLGHKCDFTDTWSFNEACQCEHWRCYRQMRFCYCQYCCDGSDDSSE